MKCNISIALCTYNGAKYIIQQLKSIENQILKPDEVIIRDDNSQDDTIKLIVDFAKYSSLSIKIYQNKPGLGVIRNFEKAISLCCGDYIAFCDQDDVWLPQKLEVSFAQLIEAEQIHGKETPILVHTDLTVVNEELREISASFLTAQGLYNAREKDALKTLVVQNYITGCTIMINSAARYLALPFPKDIIMHDWWLALVVASRGKIVFVSEPTILYRQHSSNTVGAKRYFSFSNFKKLFHYAKLIKNIQKTINQVYALQSYKLGILVQHHDWINRYLRNLEQGGMINILDNLLLGIHKQGFWRNILFYLFLCSGEYKKNHPNAIRDGS